jgi:nitroreductase
MDFPNLVTTRRATRAFKTDPIPETALQSILNLALQAPSGFNLQPTRFILVRSPQGKARLHECAFRQRQILEAPVTVIACGDSRIEHPRYIDAVTALEQQPQTTREDLGNYLKQAIPQLFTYKPSFDSIETWVNRQVMVSVAHLLLAAQNLAIDSCPMEGFIQFQVRQAFGIPEEVFVCCLIPLGYATEPLKSYGGRFPLGQMVSEERFTALSPQFF